jgi:hypothetical protein
MKENEKHVASRMGSFIKQVLNSNMKSSQNGSMLDKLSFTYS